MSAEQYCHYFKISVCEYLALAAVWWL